MAYDGYEIGPHIRQIRKRRKMTVAELSDKTGLSSSSINQIEQGVDCQHFFRQLF